MVAYRQTTCSEEVVDALDEIYFLQSAYFDGKVSSWLLEGVVYDFFADFLVMDFFHLWENQLPALITSELEWARADYALNLIWVRENFGHDGEAAEPDLPIRAALVRHIKEDPGGNSFAELIPDWEQGTEHLFT